MRLRGFTKGRQASGEQEGLVPRRLAAGPPGPAHLSRELRAARLQAQRQPAAGSRVARPTGGIAIGRRVLAQPPRSALLTPPSLSSRCLWRHLDRASRWAGRWWVRRSSATAALGLCLAISLSVMGWPRPCHRRPPRPALGAGRPSLRPLVAGCIRSCRRRLLPRATPVTALHARSDGPSFPLD
jgi:hypothetical protein